MNPKNSKECPKEPQEPLGTLKSLRRPKTFKEQKEFLWNIKEPCDIVKNPKWCPKVGLSGVQWERGAYRTQNRVDVWLCGRNSVTVLKRPGKFYISGSLKWWQGYPC